MNKNKWMGFWIGIAALVFSAQVVAQSATCVNACLASDCNATDYPTAAARNNCIANATPSCKSSCLTAVVPNLVGQLFGAVPGALAPNFNLGVVTGLTSDPNLKVISQSPPAGNEAPLHSAVAVTIESPPPNRVKSLMIFNSAPQSITVNMIDRGTNLLYWSTVLQTAQSVTVQVPNGGDYIFRATCGTDQPGCCDKSLGGVCTYSGCLPGACRVGNNPSRVWRGDSTGFADVKVSPYTW
jgi:hypothetical protein